MKNTRVMAALAALCMAGMVFGQGSLIPPGAPAPTMKTLDQLDAAIAGVSNAVGQIQDESRIDLATVAGDATYHHVISQPGSYYLSGNLAVTNENGILITAANVTLDLNGFTVSRTSGTGGTGIYVLDTGDQATVRNGSASGFQYGVHAHFDTDDVSLLNIKATQCSAIGIYAGGVGARLVDCIATQNSGSGIFAGNGASLSGCIALHNLGVGIRAGNGSTLSDCTASYNQGSYGLYAGNGSTLSVCVVSYNQGTWGILTGGGVALRGCVASYNHVTYGIDVAGSGSTVTGCTASHNTGGDSYSYGIYAWGSSVIGCTTSYNSNTNLTSTSIQGVGIYVSQGLVKDCMASNNRGDGILVGEDSLISGNQCYNNGFSIGGGAGIHVTGTDNRIENNTVTRNDRGIDVDQSGNFIVRNTASGNTTNYTIVENNKVGVIVNAPNSGAISGSTGGAGVGSTDPWDNFSF